MKSFIFQQLLNDFSKLEGIQKIANIWSYLKTVQVLLQPFFLNICISHNYWSWGHWLSSMVLEVSCSVVQITNFTNFLHFFQCIDQLTNPVDTWNQKWFDTREYTPWIIWSHLEQVITYQCLHLTYQFQLESSDQLPQRFYQFGFALVTQWFRCHEIKYNMPLIQDRNVDGWSVVRYPWNNFGICVLGPHLQWH